MTAGLDVLTPRGQETVAQEQRAAATETRATVNGGSAVRNNAYIPMHFRVQAIAG